MARDCYHEHAYQWEDGEPVYCQDCGARWADWAAYSAEAADDAAWIASHEAQAATAGERREALDYYLR